MRLDPPPPERLDAARRALRGRIVHGMNAHHGRFTSARSDGARVGRFMPLPHFPENGRAA